MGTGETERHRARGGRIAGATWFTVLIIAFGLAAGACTVRTVDSARPQPVVTLRPVDVPGDAAYFQPLGSGIKDLAAAYPTAVAVAAGAQAKSSTVGLYATGPVPVADVGVLQRQLAAVTARERTAWLRAVGVAEAELAAFLAGLQPVVVTRDALVIESPRSIAGNVAPARPIIIQAGSGVLIDDAGEPRILVANGNPVRPGGALGGDARIVGDAWPGFDRDAVAPPDSVNPAAPVVVVTLVPSTTTSTTTTTPPVPELGPGSLGPLTLDLDIAAAQATGLIGAADQPGCELAGPTSVGAALLPPLDGMVFFLDGRIQIIVVSGGTGTIQGVRLGQTADEAVDLLVAAGYRVTIDRTTEYMFGFWALVAERDGQRAYEMDIDPVTGRVTSMAIPQLLYCD